MAYLLELVVISEDDSRFYSGSLVHVGKVVGAMNFSHVFTKSSRYFRVDSALQFSVDNEMVSEIHFGTCCYWVGIIPELTVATFFCMSFLMSSAFFCFERTDSSTVSLASLSFCRSLPTETRLHSLVEWFATIEKVG